MVLAIGARVGATGASAQEPAREFVYGRCWRHPAGSGRQRRQGASRRQSRGRNSFAALTARHGRNWLTQATFTIYSSPNDAAETACEVALAGSYRSDNLLGSLSPQLKLAKPTDRGGLRRAGGHAGSHAVRGRNLSAKPERAPDAGHRSRRRLRLGHRHERLPACPDPYLSRSFLRITAAESSALASTSSCRSSASRI